MTDSLKSFLIIMRNLSRSRSLPARVPYESVLSAFEEHFECEFPVMSQLLQIKLARQKWTGDTEAMFADYLRELQHLIRIIDQMPAAAASDAGGPPSHQP